MEWNDAAYLFIILWRMYEHFRGLIYELNKIQNNFINYTKHLVFRSPFQSFIHFHILSQFEFKVTRLKLRSK